MVIHMLAPARVTKAATPRAEVHPTRAPIPGVIVAATTPPRFAPVFMRPDSIPTCRLEMSTVAAQYALIVK